MNCPRLSINDLRRLVQEMQDAPKPMPAIELPKEPELKPESPGCGEWGNWFVKPGKVELVNEIILSRRHLCRYVEVV